MLQGMDIAQFIIEKNYIGLWLILFLGLVADYYIFKKIKIHSRVFKRLLIILCLFSFPIILEFSKNKHQAFESLIILGPFIFLIFTTIFWPLPHEWMVLQLIKIKINKVDFAIEGLDDKFMDYFVTTNGKMEFAKILFFYYQKGNLIITQYNILENIDNLQLYRRQREEFEEHKIMFFYSLGAIKKTEFLIENSSINFKNSAYSYFIKALIARKKMLFNEERDHLQKAENSPNINDDLKIMIYNNYAVNAISRENKAERYEYLNRGSQKIKDSSKNKHIVLPNLIDYYLQEEDYETAKVQFIYYSELVNKSDIDDVIQWNNYRLTYYRQKNDLKNIKMVINHFDEKVLPKLSSKEKYHLNISLLRIRWNNKVGWEKSYSNFIKNIDEYLNQPFEISFKAAKEIFSVMRGIADDGMQISEKSLNKLIKYFKRNYTQIDDEIQRLPPDFIYQKCSLLKDKAWLHQIIFDYKHQDSKAFTFMLDQKIKLYYDVIDILQNQNVYFDALETRLCIPDDIFGNIRILANIQPFNHETKEKYLQIAKKEMDESLKIISHCKNDFSIINFKLMLAYYYACLRDFNQARILFIEFDSAGLSLNHCASWLQNFHAQLRSKFSKTTNK